MDKCVLEHCEFQRGGQCCLCCPKGLDGRNRRRAAYDRIQECIAKLRRVKAKTKQVDDRMVPVGIHTDGHMYRATIGYEGKIIHLASSLSLETGRSEEKQHF